MLQSSFATSLSEKPRTYTGAELRPHFLLTELGLAGTGIGAFIGPCRVPTEHLVDWEDRLAQDHIEAGEMVHFIGEFFGASLREGVLIQRLFMANLHEILIRETAARPEIRWDRRGDDLYVVGKSGQPDRKLSVSIVTSCPVSQLLHVGINIDPSGAPVPAIGLKELGIEPQSWARAALERFSSEWKGMEWACVKVKPVI